MAASKYDFPLDGEPNIETNSVGLSSNTRGTER